MYNSASRKINGKPDTCYYITYKIDGRKKTEKVDWKSEGYTPQVAAELRAGRVKNSRHGNAVKTQKEIRQDKIRHDRTLNEISRAYFDSEHGRKLKGRETDLNRDNLHLQNTVGHKQISTLSPLDIERIKSAMKDRAPATISNTLELFRRLINYGVKHNLCPSLPLTITHVVCTTSLTELVIITVHEPKPRNGRPPYQRRLKT